MGASRPGPAATAPDVASVAMVEIAAAMREDLLATVMDASLQTMGFGAEALYGPCGRHDADESGRGATWQ